jgi:chemotaxis protein methyltransferase CheR
MSIDITKDTSGYNDNLFFGFRNYLYEDHGIFINLDKKESVTTKLQQRMEQLDIRSANDYLYLLGSDPGFANEKNSLFEILDLNDYYFHSAPDQIDAVINEILPDIFNNDSKLKDKKIRILIIGRKSLIQSYSVFFALNNTFQNKKSDWTLQIQAHDLDENNPQQTYDSIYDKELLQNLDTEAVKKYFSKITDIKYKIKECYCDTVSFVNFDFLSTCSKEKLNYYDLIFCRNMMLFYKKQHRPILAENLYSLLKPGGFLFLGEEESLHSVAPDFKLFLFPGTLAYKKE